VEKTGLLKGLDAFLIRLSMRERWMLGGGGVVILFLIVFFSFVDPALERMEQLEDLIPRKERSLRELARLQEDYKGLSQEIRQLESKLPKGGRFSPLSFIEEHAAKNQIRNNIAFIRPTTPSERKAYKELPVEVKVENVTLAQVVPFLAAIENAPHYLRIKRLAIKTRFSNPDMMDITFLVLSYEKTAS